MSCFEDVKPRHEQAERYWSGCVSRGVERFFPLTLRVFFLINVQNILLYTRVVFCILAAAICWPSESWCHAAARTSYSRSKTIWTFFEEVRKSGLASYPTEVTHIFTITIIYNYLYIINIYIYIYNIHIHDVIVFISSPIHANLNHIGLMQTHTFIYKCQTHMYLLTYAYEKIANGQTSERAQITPAPGAYIPVVPLRPSPAVCLTRLYYKFQREFVVQTEPLHAVISMGQR